MSESREVALESIASLTEAIGLTVKGSGFCLKTMAARLGVEPKHLNRMLNVYDSRHFPPDLIVTLMVESKSVLPLEWLAWKMGYRLHDQSLTAILETIRDAMVAVGQEPKFAVCANGRIERA